MCVWNAHSDIPANLGVLTTTTTLLLVCVSELARAANRLAERHTRLANLDLDAILALHALNVDFEVQLSHAANDNLEQRAASIRWYVRI